MPRLPGHTPSLRGGGDGVRGRLSDGTAPLPHSGPSLPRPNHRSSPSRCPRRVVWTSLSPIEPSASMSSGGGQSSGPPAESRPRALPPKGDLRRLTPAAANHSCVVPGTHKPRLRSPPRHESRPARDVVRAVPGRKHDTMNTACRRNFRIPSERREIRRVRCGAIRAPWKTSLARLETSWARARPEFLTHRPQNATLLAPHGCPGPADRRPRLV